MECKLSRGAWVGLISQGGRHESKSSRAGGVCVGSPFDVFSFFMCDTSTIGCRLTMVQALCQILCLDDCISDSE